jgi:hypothetical protein
MPFEHSTQPVSESFSWARPGIIKYQVAIGPLGIRMKAQHSAKERIIDLVSIPHVQHDALELRDKSVPRSPCLNGETYRESVSAE